MDETTNSASLGSNPPVFQINLSLPPSERYVVLAQLYRDRMRGLRGIFDDLIESANPKIPVNLVHWLSRTFLRRLYTDEETEEIRGISRTTDIDLYLLICLNTVLDLLMGCTSGGVRTKSGSQTKMLHFRTLDWAMDPLRDLIVQLEFVRDSNPHEVLATSITYVGFVGFLTGVRKGLSASLNFRPVHDIKNNSAFYFNHLLVLLGIRQSISSLLRQCILPLSQPSSLANLETIVANIPKMPTTAAYLIFSDGVTTVTMEKDHRTAVVRSSSSFIVTTNHDQNPDSASSDPVDEGKQGNHIGLTLISSDVQNLPDLIEESSERYKCIQGKWNDKSRKHARLAKASERKKEINNPDQPQETRSSLRLRQRRKDEEKEEQEKIYQASINVPDDDPGLFITKKEAISWLTAYPIFNESTHHATLMDPSSGKVVWGKRYDADDWEWL